ncbi:META domain-containing protein [Rubrobacter tropicus]
MIESTRWRVRAIDGKAPGTGSVPTVEFGSEGQVAWYDGCLRHSGTYRFTEYELVASRRGPMEEECMKPGTRVNFHPSGNYRTQDGLLEVLYEDDGTKTILEPLAKDAELSREGTPWELAAFVEQGVTTRAAGEAPITLTFDRGTLRREGAIYGSTGCNDYRAAYEYPTARNTFERIVVADPVSYPRECPDTRDLSDENRFLEILGDLGEHPATSGNGQLTLETKDGRKLVFRQRNKEKGTPRESAGDIRKHR